MCFRGGTAFRDIFAITTDGFVVLYQQYFRHTWFACALFSLTAMLHRFEYLNIRCRWCWCSLAGDFHRAVVQYIPGVSLLVTICSCQRRALLALRDEGAGACRREAKQVSKNFR